MVPRSWAVLWELVLSLQPGPTRNVQAQLKKYLPEIHISTLVEISYDREEKHLLLYAVDPVIVHPFYS